MNILTLLNMGWRLFVREFWRGELTIIALAIILAVSSVYSLTNITGKIELGMMQKSAEFFAADKDIKSAYPIPSQFVKQAQARGLQTDQHSLFSTMVFNNDNMALAMVKAVTSNYPLRGSLLINDNIDPQSISIRQGPPKGEVWLSRRLFNDLGYDQSKLTQHSVQWLELGEIQLKVTGIIESEPDAPINVFGTGARVIINQDDVDKTEVIQPGSRISYRVLFAGDKQLIDDFSQWLLPQLSENQQLRDVKQGTARLSQSLQRAEQFLTLAGVMSLLLAAMAVSVATNLYRQRHLDSIAIYKALGASKPQVQIIYLFQLCIITLLSTLFGVLIGEALQFLALEQMADKLPSGLPSVGWFPLLLSISVGCLFTFVFAVPLLMSLFSTPSLRVLRRNLGDQLPQSLGTKLFSAFSVIALIGLYSQSVKLTVIILVVGLMLVALILSLFKILLLLSKNVSQYFERIEFSIAIASLMRRTTENRSQVVGFSLAIMLMLILYAIEHDILKEWQQQLPEGTPNHFLINVSSDDLVILKSAFQEQQIQPEQYYPVTRGRLIKINQDELIEPEQVSSPFSGSRVSNSTDSTSSASNNSAHSDNTSSNQSSKSADELGINNVEKNKGKSQSQRFGIGRELSLTHTLKLPKNNQLIEGKWLTNESMQQVSVEKGVAERLGIKLFDELTFVIGAQQVSAKVSSIRTVDWNSFQPNFYMIFSDDVLKPFAASYMTSFYLSKSEKLWFNQVLKKLPTVSLIDVESLLTQIQSVIAQVSVAIRFVLLVVIVAATLVLLAQIQHSLLERRKETVVYRTLGAPATFIQRAIVIEFMILGAVAGFIAALMAEISILSLQYFVFDMAIAGHPKLWAMGVISGAFFISAVGMFSTKSLMKLSPSRLIRHLS